MMIDAQLLSDRFARIAHESNSIEGNPLTLSQTIVVAYQQVYLPKHRIDHQREAFNHVNALWFAYGALNESLTPFFIRELHQILMADVLASAGGFRQKNVSIAGASILPPDCALVAPMVDDLCASYLAGNQDIDASVLFHSCFENVHPFEDGNGRVGRVLFAWMMMRQGILPSILSSQNKPEYFDALELANKTGDIDALKKVLCQDEQ